MRCTQAKFLAELNLLVGYGFSVPLYREGRPLPYNSKFNLASQSEIYLTRTNVSVNLPMKRSGIIYLKTLSIDNQHFHLSNLIALVKLLCEAKQVNYFAFAK